MSINRRMDSSRCSHAMKCYRAVEMNELEPHISAYLHAKTELSEKSKLQGNKQYV